GDTGYTSVGIEQFKRLLAAINRTELAFAVHVGDFQADPTGWNPNPTIGPQPCTDERYKDVYDSFQSVRHPVILTPGDNDWTDCVHLQVRKVDPLELLAKVRTILGSGFSVDSVCHLRDRPGIAIQRTFDDLFSNAPPFADALRMPL